MTENKTWFQLRPMYDYIRKQTENKKFLKYLEIGGTFSLITLFLFFAIMPTITTISSLVGDIKSKEAYISKVDLKVANLIEAQESYAQVQEKYYLVEDAFPSLAHYYDGVSNLAIVFQDSSLDITQIGLNINEDDDSTNNFFKTYQVSVNGEGQYSSVLEMIKKMFNNRRLVNTTSVQLNQLPKEDQTDSKKIRVNLSNNLYFLPDNNEKK